MIGLVINWEGLELEPSQDLAYIDHDYCKHFESLLSISNINKFFVLYIYKSLSNDHFCNFHVFTTQFLVFANTIE